MKRRDFITWTTAQTASMALGRQAGGRHAKPRVTVIGAGVFGVWTAWYALQAGAEVTLIDAWRPGHSRASSGGETRQWHPAYSNPAYAAMATRAKTLWHQWEKAWNTQLFYRTGRVLMASELGKEQVLAAHERAQKAGFPSEQLDLAALRKRYPQFNLDEVALGVFTPDIGLLAARRAVATVADRFTAGGGNLIVSKALPGNSKQGRLMSVKDTAGRAMGADQFIFACGPWLPNMFPDVLGQKLRPVRRDVFFVGAPAGDDRFALGSLPTWSFRGAPHETDFTTWYGFPSFEGRGMKLCPVNERNTFDPENDSRIVNPVQVKRAREFLARRFPALKNRPFIETRVCQVTDSIGGDFLVDRHPEWENGWFVGGGAGHGFKHGPAMGEYVAARVLGKADHPAWDKLFQLKEDRLKVFERN